MPPSHRNTGTRASLKLRDLLLQRLDQSALDLPILPEAAAAVLDACRDDLVGPRQVADTLQRDAGLAGHVLRVANSSAYAGSEPIVSLSQAVSRLGLRAVAEITLAVVLKARVFKPGRHEALVRPVWAHCAAAGGWAREIARLGRRNVESAFLCGLLHDVGRPIIVQAALDLERAHKTEFEEREIRETMDELHASIGAALVNQWGLPEWMSTAILWHHEPDSAPDHVTEARTTALADRLADWLLLEGGNDPATLAGNELVTKLDIYPDELEQLLAKHETVREVAEAFA